MAKKTEKLIVLGIDGMDPRFTKYMLDKGEMPALKEFVARGGCREDLVMLGGMPTITPPMWTTLSTGAQASTHGITGFWNVDPNDRSKLVYALTRRSARLSRSGTAWLRRVIKFCYGTGRALRGLQPAKVRI